MVETLPAWAIGWYTFLCTIAAVNTTRYLLVCWWVHKECQKTDYPDEETRWYTRRVRWLCAPYTFICAFRSILPNNYPDRTVWWDTPLSCIIFVRLLAAVAEMCFLAQLSVAMAYCSKRLYDVMPEAEKAKRYFRLENELVQQIARVSVIIIFCAQCFSTTGTVTACILWFACEESCWGFTFFIAFWAYLSIFLRARKLRRDAGRPFHVFVRGSRAYTAEAYGAFMLLWSFVFAMGIFTIDVPQWAGEYRRQLQENARMFGVEEGFHDAGHKRIETHEYKVWSYTIVWQSLYFLFGVQLSIEIAWGPRPDMSEVDQLPHAAPAVVESHPVPPIPTAEDDWSAAQWALGADPLPENPVAEIKAVTAEKKDHAVHGLDNTGHDDPLANVRGDAHATAATSGIAGGAAKEDFERCTV